MRDRQDEKLDAVSDEEHAVGEASHQGSPDFAANAPMEIGIARGACDRSFDADDQLVAEPRSLLLVPGPRQGEFRPGLGPEHDGSAHCWRLSPAFTCSQGMDVDGSAR